MSQSKIYVGNLSYDTTPEGVQEHFAQYGAIAEAKLITDRDTGRSRGFAFITYSEQQDAQSALAADGESLDGKALRVNMAKEDGGRGGRGGGGGGAGGRGGRW